MGCKSPYNNDAFILYSLIMNWYLNKTLRFFVENQFVERGLVERGLVERGLVERLFWWKD